MKLSIDFSWGILILLLTNSKMIGMRQICDSDETVNSK
jgi:hypothetical protein